MSAFHPPKAGCGYLGHYGRGLLLLPEALRCRHTLVVGGPGAGKTTSYFLPNLLCDAYFGHSAVVYDLKYPDDQQGLLESTRFFGALGRPTYLYAPSETHSMRLPMLYGVRDLTEALLLAEIITSKPKTVPAAEYHLKAARAILAATLLKVIEKRGQGATLGEVYGVLTGSAEDVKSFLGTFGWRNAEQALAQQPLGLRSVLDIRNDQFAGWLTGLITDALLIFADTRIDRATSLGHSRDNIPLEQVFCQPSLLYLGLPQSFLELESAQSLLRMSKRVIDRALLGVKDRNSGRLPVHTSLYMDELPSFSKIPRLLNNLATLRSARVALHVGIQNYAQLRNEYGPDESEALKTSNFFTKVFFPHAIDEQDAQTTSESLGHATYWDTTHAHSRHPSGASRSQSQREVRQPLLAPEEFRTFPHGQAVIQRLNGHPIWVHMPLVKDPRSLLYPLYRRSHQVAVAKPKPTTWPPLPALPQLPSLNERFGSQHPLIRGEQLRRFKGFLLELLWQGYRFSSKYSSGQLAQCSLRRSLLSPIQQQRLQAFQAAAFVQVDRYQTDLFHLHGAGDTNLGPLKNLLFGKEYLELRQKLAQHPNNALPLAQGILLPQSWLPAQHPWPHFGSWAYLPLPFPKEDS